MSRENRVAKTVIEGLFASDGQEGGFVIHGPFVGIDLMIQESVIAPDKTRHL